MATVRAICNGALRRLGRLAAGREARAVDLEDAFESLKGLYRSWVNQGTFGRLCDVIPVMDYTARPNERILRRADSDIVITLPRFTTSGWWRYANCGLYFDPLEEEDLSDLLTESGLVLTEDQIGQPGDRGCGGNGFLADLSVVVINDELTGNTQDFIFDGHTKQWVGLGGVITVGTAVQPFTVDSNAPLSFRDPNGLQCVLAMEIADQWGAEVPAVTQRGATLFNIALTHKWSMPREASIGVYY